MMAQLRGMMGRIIFLSWMVLSAFVFFLFPGRTSFIHQIVLLDSSEFQGSITRLQPVSYLLDLVVSLGSAALYFASNFCIGHIILRILRIDIADKSQGWIRLGVRLGTAFLIGQASTSIIFMILAILQILRPWTVWLILIAGLVSGLIRGGLFSGLVEFFRLRALKRQGFSSFERTILGLSLLLIIEALLYSSSRLSYDAVSMYFTNAKLIALSGKILYARDGSFLVSSLHLGVQYAAAIQAFGDQAARMISWLGGLTIILFMVAMAYALNISRQATIIAMSICLTSTAFFDLLGDGKIDLMTSAYSLSAVYWLVGLDSRDRRGTMMLIGLLVGYSIISRPFNALLLGVFIGAWIVWRRLSREETISLADLVLMGIGVGVWLIIHLVAAWLISGNPLETIETILGTGTANWQWSFKPEDMWKMRLVYPFLVTFINTAQSLGNISPLVVAFLPGFLFMRAGTYVLNQKLPVREIWIAAGTLGLWLIVSFAVAEIRYVYFLWVIIFLPVAVMAERLISAGPPEIRLTIRFLIPLVMLYIIARGLMISIATYSPVDGQGNAQCYASRLCEFIRPLNKQAPKGSRVLVLNAYRYYMRNDLLLCASNSQDYRELQKLLSSPSPRLWENLYNRGFKYISFEKNYAERHMGIDIEAILLSAPSWAQVRLFSSSVDGDQKIYQVQYPGREPVFSTDCGQ